MLRFSARQVNSYGDIGQYAREQLAAPAKNPWREGFLFLVVHVPISANFRILHEQITNSLKACRPLAAALLQWFGVSWLTSTTLGALMGSYLRTLALLLGLLFLAGCSAEKTLPSVGISSGTTAYENSSEYRIGPGDSLDITIWHNTDLSSHVEVRPDGRISMALLGDVVAAGKTPMALASEIQDKLKSYIKEPLVTITPTRFVGPVGNQIRVIGEAVQPRAIPYSAKMTLLDVMINVGGLTKYADGNRAVIVRVQNGKQETYNVELDSLIRDGDVSKNVAVEPGDVLIIPQRFF